ncbi:MAG: LPXTG cell wall anchor domain-containing protein [Clostridia bacterium]|nr:LPXTG cell wall anchor domain-containing protein [Clostridia bacterium]
MKKYVIRLILIWVLVSSLLGTVSSVSAASISSQTDKKTVGVSWFDSYEADTGSYITVENPVPAADGKAVESGTYTGHVKGEIPASQLFGWVSGHLEDTIAGIQMKNFYPHGDGKNKIGGVLFDVTFPNGAILDFDGITVSKGTSAFSKVEIHEGAYKISNKSSSGCTGTTYTNSKSYDTSKNAVTFLFTFTDSNFEGIYAAYAKNPGALITFDIPYTMEIEAGTALDSLGEITAKGQTWMHITSRLQPAYVYTNAFTEGAAIPDTPVYPTVVLTLHANNGTDETQQVTLIPDSDQESDRKLPANPFTCDGFTFIGWAAVAQPAGSTDVSVLYRDGEAFRFDQPGISLRETAALEKAGLMQITLACLFAPALADETGNIRYGDLYAVWMPEKPSEYAASLSLPGDLQVKTPAKGDSFTTEHEEAYTTKTGASLTYAALLNVSQIKQQILSEQKYYEAKAEQQGRDLPLESILLDGLVSRFVVEMEADAGLDISGAAFELKNGGRFSVTDTAVDGQKATITMTYDAGGIKNFKQLKDDIIGMDDMLEMDVTGVKVSADDTLLSGGLVMRGSVTGDFYSLATLGTTTHPFAFAWKSIQDHELAGDKIPSGIESGKDGQDAVLGADPKEEIRLTVVVAPEVELPGDLQVKTPAKGDSFTTEHEQAYITATGDSLTCAALLNVSQIKQQILGEQKYYEAKAEQQGRDLPLESILLEDLSSRFVVQMEADAGLDISGAAFDLKNGGRFSVTDTAVDGQKATIIMTYDAGSIKNFKQLADDITGMDDMLEMDVTAVKVTADDTLLSGGLVMRGSVTGGFYSLAALNTTIRPFAFSWKSTQDHELTGSKIPSGIESGKDGQDAVLGADPKEEIRLTFVVAPEVELPGDLQVKTPAKGDSFTTEHEKAYPTKTGAGLTYAALLNVSQIKQQILDEQKYYEAKAEQQGRDLPLESILLNDLSSRFIVELEADAGLDISGAAFTLKNGGRFSITDFSVDGQKATVTMTYDASSIKNFKQLADDITGMDDMLEMDVTGVKVTADNATLSGGLVMRGSVTGDFYSLATLNTTTHPFAFSWKSTQDHELTGNKIPSGIESGKDGQDAVLGADPKEEIRLTVVATPDIPGTNKYKFTFTKIWQGEKADSITWTLYNADGAVVSKKFNKKVTDEYTWNYETWFRDDAGYYLIEEAPDGYAATYKNVGSYADVTDRCYSGGTIINTKIPKTGDTSRPLVWLALAFAALGGIALITRKKAEED